MKYIAKFAWQNPLDIASRITEDEQEWVFLYSGLRMSFTGRFSMLALKMQEEISADTFDELEGKLSDNLDIYENAWFGYLSYELKNNLENLPTESNGYIQLPPLWMARFGLIAVFDFDSKDIKVYGYHKYLEFFESLMASHSPSREDFSIQKLSSNMDRNGYSNKVNHILEAINKGDIYQANLTRKFYGSIEGKCNAYQVFRDLCNISPAPYSAFIKRRETCIISASPERFLSISKEGQIESIPIKGTAPRGTNADEDAKIISNLHNSEKDRSENLMIVDLVRNDLARVCKAGSVEVTKLFEISTYATLHHMSSTISGVKEEEASALDVVKACFPPGSMTGAPKISAMRICSKLEELKRGVYSGAIGWFGGDGSADLSVVIRTLIIQNNIFEFQVGGGIVSDSNPDAEWRETITKALGIASALGINRSRLENI